MQLYQYTHFLGNILPGWSILPGWNILPDWRNEKNVECIYETRMSDFHIL